MGHWAQNQASAIAIHTFDLNPVDNEWVNWREGPTWSWESKGSGVILDEGMVSDILPGVLTSSGNIGENLELLNWQMEVSKTIE